MEKKQTFSKIDKDQDQLLKERYGADAPENGDVQPRHSQKAKKGKNAGKGRRVGLAAVLGVLLALVIGAGVYLFWILNRPEDLFTESKANVTEAPKERVEVACNLSAYATPEPTPTPTPVEERPVTGLVIVEQTPTPTPVPPETPTPEPTVEPTPAMDNIVNIMLMGIDAFENGGTTSGTEPHTDTMMVVAVNFDKDTVDLITLPRDIFTTAPGLHGFYKLNGVFNAGGGMKDMKGGFELACKAAEIWLGGITIPYYYVVDYQAVVDIVNAIGGIDYDVDQPFSETRIVNYVAVDGKYYDVGMHHLDGKGVLGYLRIRQNADGLDSSRTARQRRMMVAIYNKLKTEGKLSQVPALIFAASSGIYTNTNLAQTTSLVNYAMTKIDPDQIRTRSIGGDIWYQHYFKYIFVDQQNRLDIIKEVYGIDAEPIGVNTPEYENWLYDIGFLSMKYLRQPEKVFKVIQEQKDKGKTYTDAQIASYAACYQAYTDLDEGFEAGSARVQQAYLDPTLTKEEVKAIEKEVKAELTALNKAVKDSTLALAKTCDVHTRLEWTVSERWFADQDINEVLVAFG